MSILWAEPRLYFSIVSKSKRLYLSGFLRVTVVDELSFFIDNDVICDVH